MGSDPLDLLRCPKGCDTRFLAYLVWEGTSLRVYEARSEGGATVCDIGLRCAECNGWHYVKGAPWHSKIALDDLIEAGKNALNDFQDELNDALLREHFSAPEAT